MADYFEDSDEIIAEVIEREIAIMRGERPARARFVNGPIRTEEETLAWLKSHPEAPRCLIRKGVWFHGRGNVQDYPSAVQWRSSTDPKPRLCFQNSREFCLAYPDARYYEGIYHIFDDPDEHAWVIMKDGRVLDFTHEAVIQKLTNENATVTTTSPLYFGVEIPTSRLGVLHNLADHNQPILQLYLDKQ